MFTARELSQRLYIEPDSITQDALGWLRQVVADKPSYYDGRTVSSDEISSLGTQLDAHANVLYARVVDQLDNDLRGGRASIVSTACARALMLLTYIDSLSDEDYKRLTKQFAIHLRVATDAAYCLAKKLESRGSQQPISDDDRDSAQGVFLDLDKLLPNASGQEKIIGQARRADLAKYISPSAAN